jgi:Tfp pilus assembly protein PilP
MHPKTMIITGILVAFINVVCWNFAYADKTLSFPMPDPKGEITPLVYDTPKVPALYDPSGKVDPFESCVKENTPADVEKEKVKVPDTQLTRWGLSQLILTGTVIRHKGNMAIFKTPNNGATHVGRIGDFVGRLGVVILAIQHGHVQLSNKSVLKTNK